MEILSTLVVWQICCISSSFLMAVSVHLFIYVQAGPFSVQR
uniref:Uncharacterized protein n=1 Tax=Rhizophora mucronata TaxID=61149 RepID=A0A2P2NJW6_RHIMU